LVTRVAPSGNFTGGHKLPKTPDKKLQIMTGITSRGEKDIVNDEKFIDVLPVIAIYSE
jgi:hypothetical protein